MADVKSSVNISIGADVENFRRAMEDATKRAGSFERNLTKAAAATAAAYAAIKVSVINSLQAFAEQEKIGNQLTQALITQGIYTDKLRAQYDKLAEQTSRIVGLDDDAVKSAFAKAQAYLGSIEVTERLAQASADLATATGISLDEAMVKIAKSVTTSTNALAKNGIEVNRAVTDNQRLDGILRQVESRWGGQAQASQGVAVAFSNLKNAAGDLYEQIGEVLAPAAVALAKALTSLIDWAKESPAFIKAVAIIGTLAAGILAAVSAASALASAFGVLSGIVAPVLTVISTAGAAALAFFGSIPLGIAAAVAAVAIPIGILLAQFESVRNAASSVASAVKDFFGFGSKKEQSPEQVDQTQQAKIEANRKVQAQLEADRQASAKRLEQIEKNQAEATVIQYQEGSKRLIELKNQENQILKQLNEAKLPEDKRILDQALAQNREQQEIEAQERLARIQEFSRIEQETRAELLRQSFAVEDELTLQQTNKILESQLTENDARRQVYEQALREKVEANNRFLTEQARFGSLYATISRAINSEEVQSARAAADQLVQLSQSKSKELRSIGKAAAVTQIGIDTAQGAASVFAKLNSLVPLAAPFIGAAGAAAVLAYGAERTADVLAANMGGVVPGGGPNVDSVPAMLTPGELVVPRQNFDEVVGAVGSSRGGNGDVVAAIENLGARLEAMPRGVVVNGDVLGDDTFVDRLIQRISDRLEFGNARLVGVNA